MPASYEWTLSDLKRIFSESGFKPKKSLGQNFLIDRNLLNFIVEKANIASTDIVIEVGAGIGLLTSLIAERAKEVYAFEIDKNLYNMCKNYLREASNIQLYNEDVVNVIESRRLVVNSGDVKVVSNLPYSKYFDIFLCLLTSQLGIKRLYLLVQFDVYKKMSAKIGSAEYSHLSVIAQSLCEIRLIRKVPPDVFYPRPKVESAFVRLDTLNNPLVEKGKIKKLLPSIRFLFSERKKRLVNILKKAFRGSGDTFNELSQCLGENTLRSRTHLLEPQDVMKVAGLMYEYQAH